MLSGKGDPKAVRYGCFLPDLTGLAMHLPTLPDCTVTKMDLKVKGLIFYQKPDINKKNLELRIRDGSSKEKNI